MVFVPGSGPVPKNPPSPATDKALNAFQSITESVNRMKYRNPFANIVNTITQGANVDVNTGKLFTREEAAALPEPRQKDLIWMEGGIEQIKMVSDAVKRDRRRQNKAAKKARRKNRG